MGESSPSASPFRRIIRRASCQFLGIVFPIVAELLTATAVAQTLPRAVLYLDQGPSNNPAARAISGAFQAKIDDESGGSVFVYPENLAIPIFGGARYWRTSSPLEKNTPKTTCAKKWHEFPGGASCPPRKYR